MQPLSSFRRHHALEGVLPVQHGSMWRRAAESAPWNLCHGQEGAYMLASVVWSVAHVPGSKVKLVRISLRSVTHIHFEFAVLRKRTAYKCQNPCWISSTSYQYEHAHLCSRRMSTKQMNNFNDGNHSSLRSGLMSDILSRT